MIDKKDTQLFFEDYASLLRNSIAYVAALVRKYILSLLIIAIVCGAGALAFWYSTSPYYEANMVCSYNNARLTRKNYGELFEKLDILVKTRSYEGLSRLLGVPVALTTHLRGFEARNMAGSPLEEDVTAGYQPLYFFVRADSKDVFAPLQPALISYLSNGPYQQEIGKMEVAKITNRISAVQQNINELDSVIAAFTVFLKNAKGADSLGLNGITGLLTYKEQQQDKLAELIKKKALEESVSVAVLHGFVPPDNPSRGSKKIIWAAVLAGLFIGLCQALWREAANR